MRRPPTFTGVVVIVVLLSAGVIYFSSYYLGPGLLGYHSVVVSVLQGDIAGGHGSRHVVMEVGS
jgi:hypothetical protein